MNTRRKEKMPSTMKVLHSGETFTNCQNFQSGVLPTKRQVIERILSLSNFRTQEASKTIAKELFDRWIWCNVYPVHLLTITERIRNTASEFSMLDRWSKKRRNYTFLQKEAAFLQDIDKLFDVFCYDEKQRKSLEREYKLRMTSDDYAFYEDQKGDRKARCLDKVIPLSQCDRKFIQRLHPRTKEGEPSTSQDCKDKSLSPHFGSDLQMESDSDSTASAHSQITPPHHQSETTMQNRRSWENLARMCDRYQLSDRAGAAVGTSVLQDLGLVTNDDRSLVIDHQKLRRERERCREEIRKKEQENFNFVGGLYLDGRKDGTQTILKGPNEKHYRSVQLEEHYTLVGEPGTYYLTHLTTENGTGRAIAEKAYKFLLENEMVDELKVVGTDGTASMTGRFNGFIRLLEELVKKPLQWVICLLHTNELPLRHIFTYLDGKTGSPETFTGPIGKKLNGVVSEWPVARFKCIPNPDFPVIPQSIVDDLSTDQLYAYRICRAVMAGSVDYDLQLLEVGPVVHSRWLTLANRILRLYVSLKNPPHNLFYLAEYCITVYFPTWFTIKLNSDLVYGSVNYFDLLKRILQLSNKEIREKAVENLQKNSFFAHPENVLVSMLGDSDEKVRRLAVNKINSFRGKSVDYHIPNEDFVGGYLFKDAGKGDHNDIRRFCLPKINLEAKTYYTLVNLKGQELIQPPAVRSLTDAEIDEIRNTPLKLNYPCHNQTVERHVKVVTEASAQVVGFERRDGLIRQKLKSRKLMKKFTSKQQFAV